MSGLIQIPNERDGAFDMLSLAARERPLLCAFYQVQYYIRMKERYLLYLVGDV